jgi:hypothetical protein
MCVYVVSLSDGTGIKEPIILHIRTLIKNKKYYLISNKTPIKDGIKILLKLHLMIVTYYCRIINSCSLLQALSFNRLLLRFSTKSNGRWAKKRYFYIHLNNVLSKRHSSPYNKNCVFYKEYNPAIVQVTANHHLSL